MLKYYYYLQKNKKYTQIRVIIQLEPDEHQALHLRRLYIFD